ncbi:hypothetical protein OSTOST_20795 [Ostertagia ostertagi]
MPRWTAAPSTIGPTASLKTKLGAVQVYGIRHNRFLNTDDGSVMELSNVNTSLGRPSRVETDAATVRAEQIFPAYLQLRDSNLHLCRSNCDGVNPSWSGNQTVVVSNSEGFCPVLGTEEVAVVIKRVSKRRYKLLCEVVVLLTNCGASSEAALRSEMVT